MVTYATLKHPPTTLLAATGLTVAEFDRLLPAFQRAYTERYPPHLTAKGAARKHKAGAGPKSTLATDADRLLFTLVYMKTNPLQELHGLQFELSQAQANYWIHRFLPVVKAALAELGLLPERDGAQVATNTAATAASLTGGLCRTSRAVRQGLAQTATGAGGGLDQSTAPDQPGGQRRDGPADGGNPSVNRRTVRRGGGVKGRRLFADLRSP